MVTLPRRTIHGFLVASVLLFLLLSGSFVTVEAVTVTAKGTAVVQGDDIAMARDTATSDALRKAVEMAVGSEIQTETVMENYELLNERIYSKSQGYISSFNVVDEKREENLYWVTVRAEVSEGALKDDLSAIGLLMAKKKMPRIIIMIAEENVGYNTWNLYRSSINEAENTLINIFKDRGFRVLDANSIQSIADREAAMKALSGDDQSAAVVARKAGADIIIMGKASAESGGSIAGSSLHSCSGDVNARVIRADTGEIIASGSEHSVKPHINQQTGRNEALRAAATTLSDTLIQKIISRWQTDVYTSNSVDIFIVTTTADEAQDFKSFLMSSIRGTSDVIVRDVSGKSARLELTYRGDGEDLAKALKDKTFKGKKISIVEQTQNKVTLSFQ